jgi:hypothetical protein
VPSVCTPQAKSDPALTDDKPGAPGTAVNGLVDGDGAAEAGWAGMALAAAKETVVKPPSTATAAIVVRKLRENAAPMDQPPVHGCSINIRRRRVVARSKSAGNRLRQKVAERVHCAVVDCIGKEAQGLIGCPLTPALHRATAPRTQSAG